MKTDELKSFLRLRGLRVTERKQELVVRAFIALENDVPIVPTAEEVETELAREYGAKMRVTGEEIPDPFKLLTGWIEERHGVKQWPMTLYPDIYNFLSFHPL